MCELQGKKPPMALKLILVAAAVLSVAAALFLVPSSPALMVDTPVYVGAVDEWGYPAGFAIPAYAICIAAGLAGAIALTAVLGWKRCGCLWKGMALALVSAACALVCGHLLFCAVRWSYIINDLGGSAAFLVQFWEGGYTMYGAVFGGLLGALLVSKATRTSLAELLDILVPGMALLILCGRFGEQFTSQGMASYRLAEALSMLPFAGMDEWGSPLLRVYAYEAIAAAAALIASLAVLLRKGPAGRAAETGLLIISVLQIMLDSWRGDELIKFGFVCLNMVMAAVVVVFILAARIIRRVKAKGWTPWTIARIPLFLLSVGVVVLVEFGLDGKFGIRAANTLLYSMQAAAIAVMLASVLIDDGRRKFKV